MPKFSVVDVETSIIRGGETPRTRFWGLYIEDEGYERFSRTDDLLVYLKKRGKELRCYHHHDFDPCQLIVDGYMPKISRIRGGRIIRSTVCDTDWINSYALFPSKLAEILESCGFKKLPLACSRHNEEVNASMGLDKDGKPLPSTGIPPNPYDFYDICKACRVALQERNEVDCRDALQAFRHVSTVYSTACGLDPMEGGFATAAGCSFSAAERYAGPLPVDLSWRSAYRGGRVEAFRIGDCGDAAAYDINSSYPYAFADAPSLDELIHARVHVEVDHAAPFWKHTNFEADYDGPRVFLFPQGTFETLIFASNYERYIRQHGGIRSVEILQRTPIDLGWLRSLAPFVRQAYETRKRAKESGNAGAIVYALKIFLNSVYGRIGMRPGREYVSYSDTIPEDGSYYEIPGGYLVFRVAPTMPKANYLMAGWITDNARARLYDALRRTDSYYCDTDSVYSHPKAKKPKPLGKGMGQWKTVETGNLYIETVKDYRFGNVEKRKGGAFSTLWTVRRALNGAGVQAIEKNRLTHYDRREIFSDGSTQPITLWE